MFRPCRTKGTQYKRMIFFDGRRTVQQPTFLPAGRPGKSPEVQVIFQKIAPRSSWQNGLMLLFRRNNAYFYTHHTGYHHLAGKGISSLQEEKMQHTLMIFFDGKRTALKPAVLPAGRPGKSPEVKVIFQKISPRSSWQNDLMLLFRRHNAYFYTHHPGYHYPAGKEVLSLQDEEDAVQTNGI